MHIKHSAYGAEKGKKNTEVENVLEETEFSESTVKIVPSIWKLLIYGD